MKANLAQAIQNLRPSAEFSYTNNDYKTIVWDLLPGKAPTQKEVNDELQRMETAAESEAEAKATARAAILDRLGLTADEAVILLG